MLNTQLINTLKSKLIDIEKEIILTTESNNLEPEQKDTVVARLAMAEDNLKIALTQFEMYSENINRALTTKVAMIAKINAKFVLPCELEQ